MQRGLAWHEAAEAADARLSGATAFRALRIVRTQGEEALEDGRQLLLAPSGALSTVTQPQVRCIA